MTVREAKKLWRHRQATIQSHIRTLRDSDEQSSRDHGIIQRIIRNYYREWDRYNQMIHANDRFRGSGGRGPYFRTLQAIAQI